MVPFDPHWGAGVRVDRGKRYRPRPIAQPSLPALPIVYLGFVQRRGGMGKVLRKMAMQDALKTHAFAQAMYMDPDLAMPDFNCILTPSLAHTSLPGPCPTAEYPDLIKLRQAKADSIVPPPAFRSIAATFGFWAVAVSKLVLHPRALLQLELVQIPSPELARG
jgi:hypothetical protein